jgi:transposase
LAARPPLRDRQSQVGQAVRPGHGPAREDRPDRCRADRRLRRDQAAEAGAAALARAAAADRAGGKAAPGRGRSWRAEAAAPYHPRSGRARQPEEAIAFFTRQAKALTGQIGALIETDPVWQALDKALRSVKGVADRTVATLLADLSEIGTVSNKAVVKLVGLAPIANDSGQRNGPRSIQGGRAAIRSILFLVADGARKYDPSLADFRDRLLAKGKPKMVVRVALARKLLVRLNAKARETRAKLAYAL